MADTTLANPLVYEHSTDDMTSMGQGHVPGVLSCVVQSKYDNAAQLTMIATYSQRAMNLLQKDRILLVDAGDGWKRQMFRIFSVVADWADKNRQITVEAAHVGGDLFGNVLVNDLSLANASPDQLFSAFLNNLAEPVTIDFTSSITDVAVVSWDATKVDNAQNLLFGRDDKNPSFTSLYRAEWWFDNYSWRLDRNVGRDTGIVIKYGQHLQSLQNSDSIENIYTAVRPISKYTPGKTGMGNTDNYKDISGAALIQYAGTGGLPVYDTPFKEQTATGKLLTNGTRFKIFKYCDTGTINDHTWYNLGGAQWVDGGYLSFEKGQSSQFPSTVGNKATGKGTIAYGIGDKSGVVTTYTGVITVNYVGPGKVAIWDSPWAGNHTTGKFMANGSAYNVYAKATDNKGRTWYKLGGNQWVNSQYVSLDKQKDYAYEKVRGIGTTKVSKGKIALWNRPNFNGSIVRMIASGTRWQVYGQASGGGSSKWYDLGGNQWIDGQYMSFDAAKDVEPKPVTGGNDTSSKDTTPGKVWSYNSPGNWNTQVKQYTSGQQVTIYGQGSASGETWYNIGTNEWIQADYLTFGNDTDVSPSGSADNMNAAAAEVTVTLPEKYIAVPMPDGRQYEHQRIVNFDASQYDITTVEDLRSITQAYISDNNIGQPKVSLTIGFIDLQERYKNLSQVRLYDTVTVFLPEIGLSIKAEVTDVIYDTLLQANTQVTIGNRPLTTTDDLAEWAKKAEDKAASNAQKTADKVNDLDLTWKQDIDSTTRSMQNQFDEFGRRSSAQQTEWQNMFTQKWTDDINSYKAVISQQVQDANRLSSIVKYTNNQVQFYNGNGAKVGEMGAGGLIYYDTRGNATSIVSSDGKIIANQLVANVTIDTPTIKSAMIDGGTIKAVNTITAINPYTGMNTTISGDWGLSTNGGIHAYTPCNFESKVDIGGDLFMGGNITLRGGRNLYLGYGSYLRVDASTGGLWYHGGPGWSRDYKIGG